MCIYIYIYIYIYCVYVYFGGQYILYLEESTAKWHWITRDSNEKKEGIMTVSGVSRAGLPRSSGGGGGGEGSLPLLWICD